MIDDFLQRVLFRGQNADQGFGATVLHFKHIRPLPQLAVLPGALPYDSRQTAAALLL